jgi:hypothetical protein
MAIIEQWTAEDAVVPDKKGNYLKLKPGENRVRMLSKPLRGYVQWIEEDGGRKPIRHPFGQKPKNVDAKFFWCTTVWDYGTESVAIWEITQRTIQASISELAHNPQWGSPSQYDLTITRSGNGLDTEYRVMPSPASELSDDVKAKVAETRVDLEALLHGEDPFAAPESPF